MHAELSHAAGVVHEAYLPENGALGPSHVVDTTNTPHAPHVSVWIPSINCVLVVEEYGDAEGLGWRRGPLQDLGRVKLGRSQTETQKSEIQTKIEEDRGRKWKKTELPTSDSNQFGSFGATDCE